MEHLSVELETNKDTYKLKFKARTFDCWCLKFLIGMLAKHQVLLLKFSQLSMIEGKTFLPSNSSSFTSSLLQLYKRNSFYLGSAFRSEGRSFRMCIQPGQTRRCATSGYQSSSTSMIMDWCFTLRFQVSQAISPYLGVHPVVGGLYTIDFECGLWLPPGVLSFWWTWQNWCERYKYKVGAPKNLATKPMEWEKMFFSTLSEAIYSDQNQCARTWLIRSSETLCSILDSLGAELGRRYWS